MKIAFIGDVHGCVHQCLAAIHSIHLKTPLDAIFQVGDLGAWPDVGRMYAQDPPSRWFAEDNTRTLDWFDLLDPMSPNSGALKRMRQELGQPVMMIRGNHDDVEWLKPGRIDAFDLFHYVSDASVMTFGGLKLGLLGGIEVGSDWPTDVLRFSAPHAFDEQSLEKLAAESLDVLVTHDGPEGIAKDWRGKTQGSKQLMELIKQVRPRWHIAGHYHHLIGPRRVGGSVYVGLSCLVHPISSRWDVGAFDPTGCVQSSSIVVLDTESGSLAFPERAAMQRIDKHFEISSLYG